jgi:pimeloyl-ACP methyl ester carboxylesterase
MIEGAGSAATVADDRMLPSTRHGTGEPLLLLHGLGTTRDDFDRILGILAESYDVIAVDMPGQGEAPGTERRPTIAVLADALEADLDARGVALVHILGNSLGGRVALELARRHRARSVVAIAPSGLSIVPERLYQVAGMALTATAVRLVRPLLPVVSKHRAARAIFEAGLRVRPWATTKVEFDALASGFGSEDFWRLLWWAIAMDVPTRIAEIDCPVLLAQGVGDWVAAGQTVRFLPCIADARFRLLPFAGHAAHGDRPLDVVDMVHETTARSAPLLAGARPVPHPAASAGALPEACPVGGKGTRSS